jgi:hypothetical protein
MCLDEAGASVLQSSVHTSLSTNDQGYGVEFSLVLAGVIVGTAVVVDVILLVTRPWPRGATAFARQWRLPLTPEVAVLIAGRLRVRIVTSIAAIGVLGAVMIGSISYAIEANGAGGGLVLTQAGGGQLVGVWLLVSVAQVIGRTADAATASRRAGSRVARLEPPSLDDFIPPRLIWAIRTTWLLPALAMAWWLGVPSGVSSRFWPHHFTPVVVAIAVAAPVVGLLVELWQRRIIRGPQRASSGLELAYDDAFRAATVHQLAMIGVWFASLACNLITAAPMLAEHRSFRVFGTITFAPLVIGFGILMILSTPWVRQRVRMRLAPAIQADVQAVI